MSRLVTLFALALMACGFQVESFSPASACGWHRQEDVLTLGQEAPCWRLETARSCVAADPGIETSCDLPEHPKGVWRAGEQVAFWCKVGDLDGSPSRMVEANCVE